MLSFFLRYFWFGVNPSTQKTIVTIRYNQTQCNREKIFISFQKKMDTLILDPYAHENVDQVILPVKNFRKLNTKQKSVFPVELKGGFSQRITCVLIYL